MTAFEGFAAGLNSPGKTHWHGSEVQARPLGALLHKLASQAKGKGLPPPPPPFPTSRCLLQLAYYSLMYLLQ